MLSLRPVLSTALNLLVACDLSESLLVYRFKRLAKILSGMPAALRTLAHGSELQSAGLSDIWNPDSFSSMQCPATDSHTHLAVASTTDASVAEDDILPCALRRILLLMPFNSIAVFCDGKVEEGSAFLADACPSE